MYQIFDSLGGRFNSEFGMESFPHLSTIEYFIENEADKHQQSYVMDFHNKAGGHERRLATYLVENLRTAADLEVSLSDEHRTRSKSNILADTHIPHTGRAGRDYDVWLSWLAPAVG